jgi:Txe/YoeB family toxin of Txe-Axe toxin-antitoxin module
MTSQAPQQELGITSEKRMQQLIKRIQNDTYKITQQDLEFISDNQFESQHRIIDAAFEKKVQDAKDAYDNLAPGDGSLFAHYTAFLADEDSERQDKDIGQLRRLNPEEFKAAQEDIASRPVDPKS